jgi:hypothetical protein
MTPARLRVLRAAAQLLAGEPARTAEEVVRHHLALQAQDLRAAQLALRARVPRLTPQDVDAALNDRAFVVAWVNRGTLHFICPEDVHWLVALTAPTQAAAVKRRLKLDGIEPRQAQRAIKTIGRALADDGPLTRAQLVERTGVEGQPFIHLAFAACYEGVAVRGPLVGRQHAYVRTEDWIGPAPKRIDRDASLAELARRYLAAFGPATVADAANWTALRVRDVRAALAAAEPLVRYTDEAGRELLDVADGLLPPEDTPAPARLLPRWDNTILGHADRARVIPADYRAAMRVDANGADYQVFLVDGFVAGRWRLEKGRAVVEPLRRLAADAKRALADEAERVEAFVA